MLLTATNDSIYLQSMCIFSPNSLNALKQHNAPYVKNMSPKLYMLYGSSPVRAVLITAKAIGLELDLEEINLLEQQHLTPEYLEMNPQHTVPTLVDDDGFVAWDSHAIITYLVSKYGKNDSLYPKDLKKRVVVDQRLHFDSSVIFPTMLTVLRPILYHGYKKIDQDKIEAVHDIYEFLDKFLKDKAWMAGNFKSVADYSIFASVSSVNTLIPIDDAKYSRLIKWLKKIENVAEVQENVRGLEEFRKIFISLLNS